MVNHPNRKLSPILALVRATIGRRHEITRAQMRDLLNSLEVQKLIELNNGWSRQRSDGDYAQSWTDACRDVQVISVLSPDDPTFGSNLGSVRHDYPGSMHPQMRATVMFAPPDACSADGTWDNLRARTKWLLIVGD